MGVDADTMHLNLRLLCLCGRARKEEDRLINRTEACFDLKPKRLAADTTWHRSVSRLPKTTGAQTAVIGADIGKNSFHVAGHDNRGAIVLRPVCTALM